MSRFLDVLTAAIRDFTTHGFDSEDRLLYWMEALRRAALDSLVPEAMLKAALNDNLGAIYKRMVEKGGIMRFHPGVSRMTLDAVQPRMRAELDRRIMASANLIKLNRQAAIEKTLQRFSGWSTSIPAGGSRIVDKVDTKSDIRKALASLPFAERRVLIDQGHKFTGALNEILAKQGNAIAVVWESHWRQAGYNYREDHKERDGKVYTLRGNWAQEKGLMKPGSAGYYDEVTAVAEEPFCRCNGRYLYSLRDLPDDMLTNKGREALTEARAKIKAMMQ